jgi:hypothetical protein
MKSVCSLFNCCMVFRSSCFMMSVDVRQKKHDSKRTTEEWVNWAINNGFKDICLDPKGEAGKVFF